MGITPDELANRRTPTVLVGGKPNNHEQKLFKNNIVSSSNVIFNAERIKSGSNTKF